MTIRISFQFFFFNFRKRKLDFITFFSFFSISIPFYSPHSLPNSPNSHPIQRIPTLIPSIPTLNPHIPTLIPAFPPWFLAFPPPFPHSHLDSRIPTLIPHVPTLISRVPIIPLIPFRDSPFRPLQIAKKHRTFFGEYTSRDENETCKFPGEGRKNIL